MTNLDFLKKSQQRVDYLRIQIFCNHCLKNLQLGCRGRTIQKSESTTQKDKEEFLKGGEEYLIESKEFRKEFLKAKQTILYVIPQS